MGKGLRAVSGQANVVNSIVGVGIGSRESAKGGDDQVDTTGEGETLVIRGTQGVFYDSSGTLSRHTSIDYSAHHAGPEDLAYSEPFIIQVLPPDPVSSAASSQSKPSSSRIEIRLKQTLTVQQRIVAENHKNTRDDESIATVATSKETSHHHRGVSIKLLSITCLSNPHQSHRPSPTSVYYLTSPNDKSAQQAEGSTLWRLVGRPWTDILDDFLAQGRFNDGQSLLTSLKYGPLAQDSTSMLERYGRQFTTLQALSDFSTGHYERAINQFIQLDITPAKVVALYPQETISAGLGIPTERWVEVFGGPEGGRLEPLDPEAEELRPGTKKSQETAGTGTFSVLKGIAHLGGGGGDAASIKSGKGSGGGGGGGETASIRDRDYDAASTADTSGSSKSVTGDAKGQLVYHFLLLALSRMDTNAKGSPILSSLSSGSRIPCPLSVRPSTEASRRLEPNFESYPHITPSPALVPTSL